MKYSIIVPVYNRPDEVDELLESLTQQTLTDFEVIIVEDGSNLPCEEVCRKYDDKLNIHYYRKDNSGPGQSRNYGAERASGVFLLILDSDVVLPETYLESINCELYTEDDVLKADAPDAFGGADASHPSFTPVQKAISYSMTSFFTTGGIRGSSSDHSDGEEKKASKKKALDKFYPRSYNMGIRRDVYAELGGFSKMRFGEDIDFSYRIVEAGYKCRLINDAWVWHKRRTDFRKFFRQVYNSGIARINLEKRHPGTMKLVHMLPMVFTVGVCSMLLLSIVGVALMCPVVAILPLLPLMLYSLLILVDSSIQNGDMKVGMLSIPAAFVQLMGYGMGFIEAWWKRVVRGKDEFQAFEKTFYK